MHCRRKWQPTPVFLPGRSQGWGSLVSCHLWGHTESDTTEATWQQQQQWNGRAAESTSAAKKSGGIALVELFELWSQTSCFFHEAPCLLERMIDRPTGILIFSQKWRKLFLQGKQPTLFVADALEWKFEFEKLRSTTVCLTASQD